MIIEQDMRDIEKAQVVHVDQGNKAGPAKEKTRNQ
jgi:hypothetical protein